MRGHSVWQASAALCGALLVNLFFLSSLGWGSLRVGNAELSIFYAQQHAFQYDDGEYGMNWVQFRNELAIKFTYNKLIDRHQLFDQIHVPFIEQATFFAHYLGRFDPVYLIRSRYQRLFDKETIQNWVFPENEFREIYLDLDFGKVGPGYLSTRLGRQQVVWGESDLFRSLDIIHPLKFDQNSIGERFDDWRTPLWIAKFLYNIGDVGPFGEVFVEPFFSPNWQPIFADVIIPGLLRLHDNDLPRFQGFGALGQPLFRSKAGTPKPFNQAHPWALAKQGPNAKRDIASTVCLYSVNCIDSKRGERLSAVFTTEWDDKGIFHGRPHGWEVPETSMAGVRVMGKTGFGVDFSLNYLFKRTEGVGTFDLEELIDRKLSYATIGLLGPNRGILVPRVDRIYGAGLPGQDLYTGIARCTGSEKPLRGIPGAPAGVRTSAGFSGAGQRIGNQGHQESAILVNTDLHGYNANDDPSDDVGIGAGVLTQILGNPLGLDLSNLGPVIPVTACAKARFKFPWTHIAAFTLTYNDYDYTGAIFRMEQSYSTKEGQTKFPIFAHQGIKLLSPTSAQHMKAMLRDGATAYSGVWKSMVGFDLIRSFSSFPGLKWTRHLPLDMGKQATFFSGQFLTEYGMNNMSNRLGGITAPACGSFNLSDRCTRWNLAATFFMAGGGYGRGRFEPALGLGYDLTTWESVLVYRMFWHHLFGIRKLDFYGGTVAFMGSKNQQGWLGLSHFADKDVLFLRLIYYLL